MIPLLQASQFPGRHSVLEPAGAQAALIKDGLWDPMFVTASVTFALVVAALLWALLRRRVGGETLEDPARQRRLGLTVSLATAVTTIVLFVFLVVDSTVGRATTATPGHSALQIRVTGHQWWWEVQYRDSLAQHWVTTANEIHIPVGRPVVVELRSTDVIHSFWPPNLSAKRDLIPGHENSLWLEADSSGEYRGQCAEYCGHQHAKMAFLVVAEPSDSFAGWLAGQRDTAATPADSLTRRGQEVFLGSACPMCHAVAGTPAGSRVGPDLTHLGSRRTLAAGTLPNTRGNLAGWIVNPQAIKPGAKMPPNALSPDDLQALLAYLETLR
ncbi:MAG TPA: cytochrome c oxidase subunit II [Gemmatimonadales bacterium]|nr:cytochrome c oxidase subunit II [Gemmatimonadales bacterium]